MTLLQAEWGSVRDTTSRIANLAGTSAAGIPRLNGNYFLRADSTDNGSVVVGTVHDDQSADKITGSSGLDWVFVNLDGGTGNVKDTVTDNNKKVVLYDLDFIQLP